LEKEEFCIVNVNLIFNLIQKNLGTTVNFDSKKLARGLGKMALIRVMPYSHTVFLNTILR